MNVYPSDLSIYPDHTLYNLPFAILSLLVVFCPGLEMKQEADLTTSSRHLAIGDFQLTITKWNENVTLF